MSPQRQAQREPQRLDDLPRGLLERETRPFVVSILSVQERPFAIPLPLLIPVLPAAGHGSPAGSESFAGNYTGPSGAGPRNPPQPSLSCRSHPASLANGLEPRRSELPSGEGVRTDLLSPHLTGLPPPL
jgi:hypothetical protein